METRKRDERWRENCEFSEIQTKCTHSEWFLVRKFFSLISRAHLRSICFTNFANFLEREWIFELTFQYIMYQYDFNVRRFLSSLDKLSYHLFLKDCCSCQKVFQKIHFLKYFKISEEHSWSSTAKSRSKCINFLIKIVN